MKGKILAGFVLIFLAISLVGYYSFDSLSRLVAALERESRPNPKNLQLKEILFDLSNAESSVRAYTITLDANYLNPFYESLITIDGKVNNLVELTQDDTVEMVWLDSMANLIDHKYFLLYDLIELKQDDKRVDIFSQVLENIDRYDIEILNLETINRPERTPDLKELPEVNPVEVETAKEAKKPNIFERLFGGRRRAKKDTTVETQTPEIAEASEFEEDEQPLDLSTRENEDFEEYKKRLLSAVAEIRATELSTTANLQQREIELFQLDNEDMMAIRTLMNQIEERERQISLERSENLQNMASLTQDRIYWIGGISLALFTILVIIIIRDVSVNNKTRQKLQEAKDEAEKLAKVKEEFMSNISHEIRTPINSILGFARQLDKTSLDTKQRSYLDVLSKSSEHLLAIINDVLDYSKLESGSVKLEEIGFKPEDCVNEITNALQPFADSKSLEIKTEFEDFPEILIGDPVRYRQILINLVNNAIKFTKKGSITVKIESVLGAGRCKLKTSVKDTGIGIPPSKIFAVFKTFNQVDNSTTREYGGSGLGLSICKKLVDAQNGKIWVTSKEGHGSVFNFEIIFPIGTEKDLPEATIEASPANEVISKKSILVVDDERYNLMLFRAILENHHANVITTDQPLEVENILHDKPIDLILMDIQMPAMDGITLTKKLRDQLNIRIPILALTAATNNTERMKCIEAGFDGFLVKPVEEAELINSIASFVGWDEMDEGSRTARKGDDIDLDSLFEIGNNDLDFVYNMLVLFINNFSNGLLELKENFKKKDIDNMSLVAHRMVAPCRHLGLEKLVEILKSIENSEGKAISEIGILLENLEKASEKMIYQLRREVDRIKPPEVKQ